MSKIFILYETEEQFSSFMGKEHIEHHKRNDMKMMKNIISVFFLLLLV